MAHEILRGRNEEWPISSSRRNKITLPLKGYKTKTKGYKNKIKLKRTWNISNFYLALYREAIVAYNIASTAEIKMIALITR